MSEAGLRKEEASTLVEDSASWAHETRYRLPVGADAYFLSQQAKENVVCYVCSDLELLNQTKELLSFFNQSLEVLTFPEWDCLPYDRMSPSNEVVGRRISTLQKLKDSSARVQGLVILTTVSALSQKVLPKKVLQYGLNEIRAGGFVNPEKLAHFLVENGFNKTDTVREPGEFAVRGGIVDIFPSDQEKPVRLDLFDHEIETLKYFDPVTQITQGSCDVISLNPASEIFLNEETISRFRKNYRSLFGAVHGDDDLLFHAISEGKKYQGMEHWQPLFYEEMSCLSGYLPSKTKVFFSHQCDSALRSCIEHVEDFYNARVEQAEMERKAKHEITYKPLPLGLLYMGFDDVFSALDRFDLSRFSPFKNPSVDEPKEDIFAAEQVKTFVDNSKGKDQKDIYQRVGLYLKTQQEQKRKTFVSCFSEGSRKQLMKSFEDAGFDCLVEVDCFSKAQDISRGKFIFVVSSLEKGFLTSGFAFVTEQDILGDRLAKRIVRKKDSEHFIQEVSSLREGDLVVHIQHGIGRFLGLEIVNAGGVAHDCLKVEYDGGDKLFVPVENIEVLTRYGADYERAQLDKLGGSGWHARKARVKKNLLEMADDLLQVAAARELKEAPILEVSEGLYDEFSSHFPYRETADQLTSIEAVLDDFHKGRPMDRLVCGDVGFGKTEVAIRAAFVAAMAGMQVAIVAPTTLLARQHYLEFTHRFKGLPLRVEQLSRLVKPKQSNEVKKHLADGSVEVVIGTHALLSQNIQFNNLGLLIVDEEQKFGVKQKERLKSLKDNVHVLTLTATPIPRTLQLALTGVRDLSLITTPPVDRLAVRTYATAFDPVLVREALMREHYRSGQSFVVCPRIGDLDEMEETLKDLVPELKIIKAHGQMPTSVLEDRITAYYEGKYDILLATNIIESGLDIPNANTMIVHRSELFGLAQLYQIRGRIGRSKIRGYAYLTYDPKKKLTKQAEERLRILERLDTLGAGFEIASHDMDLRGGGNLLGEEQSGHVRDIGIELYQKMLEEAIDSIRNGGDAEGAFNLDQQWSPQINIGTNVLIPEGYIEDLNVRLSIYRRASDLTNEGEVESFTAELIDRFGAIPDEVHNLLHTISLKILCKQVGVEKLEIGPQGAVLSFRNNDFKKVESLLSYIHSKAGTVKLRPDQKLVLIKSWPNLQARVKGVKQLLCDLIAL